MTELDNIISKDMHCLEDMCVEDGEVDSCDICKAAFRRGYSMGISGLVQKIREFDIENHDMPNYSKILDFVEKLKGEEH